MSRATAKVKFPDGTVKYGVYNGTIDVYWRPLFKTEQEAWDAWRKYYNAPEKDDSKWLNTYDDAFYDVEVADDYGSGDTYISRASKSQLVGAIDVDYMNKLHEGLPEWWTHEAPSSNNGVDV